MRTSLRALAAAELTFKELKVLLSNAAKQMRDGKLEAEARKTGTKAKAAKAFEGAPSPAFSAR